MNAISILLIILIALAFGYIAHRHFFRRSRKKCSCEGCSLRDACSSCCQR